MTKPKQKNSFANIQNKKSISVDDKFQEDDSWVIVKKQIVRILIPPLTTNKRLKISNSEPSQSQAVLTEPEPSGFHLPNQEIQKHIELKLSSLTDHTEKPLLLPPKLDIPTARRSPRPVTTIQKLPKKAKHIQINTLRHHYMPTLHSRSKLKKPAFSFLGSGLFLSQRMRASILEKKLQKAGGISRWLASMGLARFVTIFQRKKVGKFQLANISMKKLKDMGVDAVGPRRKLMHAIDCICEPSCFGAL